MDKYKTYLSIIGFIPIKYHYENNDNWTLEEAFNHFNMKGYLPSNLIAFASDYGGSKFCIDLESGIYLMYI
ncbi:SMI1/KNR4 family protein [Chryseobacterium formosus]|uniref:SMI1/KNR4 family protein n=1 Tax=Chryseobacterium formosus TaxID=1537363 RepID=A0ABT3XVI0_9FLAO|nr:SMI1/KNR4 family protein [Chryseobacterium formosus]MCX8525680.1 SMI1/KNR4 family protein [Chryseobacterium formosus]